MYNNLEEKNSLYRLHCGYCSLTTETAGGLTPDCRQPYRLADRQRSDL